MLEVAGLVGLSPSETLGMTPAEFSAYINGALRREDSHTMLMYAHANWSAVFAAGKRPKGIEKLLYTNHEQKRRKMTDWEMYQQARAINKALGPQQP